MKTFRLFIVLMLLPLTVVGKSEYDLGKPFGFCTRSSRTSSAATSAYNITGGGTYTYPITNSALKVTVLKSTGDDMATTITNAIKNYDVIVFDGSDGDFIIGSTMSINSVKNRTLLGINGAKLCSKWSVTDEIRNALTEAGVPSMSTSSGTGGTLTNGSSVSEQAEYQTRQIIIDMTGDKSEAYRSSGVLFLRSCENFIIRNIQFQGPGSIDVSGSDLLSLYGSKHVWVDHCDFCDGMDGNFDITQKADFVTVSWCTFSYTERSFMHQNTNLVGSSDSESTGYLNVTFALNEWGAKCRARMPMARVGKIHMLNNYYNCAGNGTACINPRKNSEFLIEGNYIDSGVYNFFSQGGATAWTWTSTNRANYTPESYGTVTVPYTYNEIKASLVPTEVGTWAGATLNTNDDWAAVDNVKSDDGNDDDDENLNTNNNIKLDGNRYIVDRNDIINDDTQVVGRDITLTFGNNAGWNTPSLPIETTAEYANRYIVTGTGNPKDSNGKNYSATSKNTPVQGTYYVFTPTANGTLSVEANIFMGKTLWVTEDAAAIASTVGGKAVSAGAVVDNNATTTGEITIDVKSGSKYHFFCSGSKLSMFGFRFVKDSQLTGDINNDNAVNMADANAIVNYSLGKNSLGENFDSAAADTDDDGKVTINDAKVIITKILGKKEK